MPSSGLIRKAGVWWSLVVVAWAGAAGVLLPIWGCGIFGGDSPQQAFQRLKKAVAEENWQEILTAMDEQSQTKLVAIHWAVVALASLADKQAEELLQKFDVSVQSVLGPALLGLFLGKAEPEKIAKEIEQKMTQIKNRPEFLRETNRWLQAKGFGDRSFLSQVHRTQLKEVRIQEETATAELTEPILFNQTQITFRKQDRRWLVVL
jgi:hypothetical protein